MADEAKIKINGTLIPTPSEISVEINDLDSIVSDLFQQAS